MINLHESMGPDQDRTRDPWICSQTHICSQTRYQLRYAARQRIRYLKDQIHMIEMVQRGATRYTINRFRNTSSVSSMIDQIQWESLESRRSKIKLTLFFNVIHNLTYQQTIIWHLQQQGHVQLIQRSADNSPQLQIPSNSVSFRVLNLCGTLFQLL